MTGKLEGKAAEMGSLLESAVNIMVREYKAKGIKIGFEEGFEKGFEEGIEIGRAMKREEELTKIRTDINLTAIENMVKMLHLTEERGMAVLNIPEYEYSRYRELLKKNKGKE